MSATISDWYTDARVAEIVALRKRRVVYFIRAACGVGPVKIGCSTRPVERAAELSIWSPFALTVLTTVPGDYELERRFQALFWHDRSHSEWFAWSPEMARVIEAVSAGTFDIATLPPPAPTAQQAKRAEVASVAA